MQRRILRRRWPRVFGLALIAALITALGAPSVQAAKGKGTGTYTNPLNVRTQDGASVESCADPSVIKGQTAGDNYWYMYCTTDPLNSEDKTGDNFNFRLVPMFRSLDLVNWTYMGDAFTRDASGSIPNLPWAAPNAGIWAPEIDYFNGKYYLYYGVTDVTDATSGSTPNCPNDNAIGVATAPTPLGPWTDSGDPVVDPRPNGPLPTCNFFWTYDPEVIIAQDRLKYIYYGSYYGGIFVQKLSSDGLEAIESPTQITIANRYEGSEVVVRDGFYYLFVSATNCCNGPLTAYSVFVGRSASPTGPFVDREGVPLLAGRVGGTPFIVQNGNEWVGPGHNTVFQDVSGQWWTIYHAVNEDDPYFEGAVGFTKRPVLLDAIDWVNGWPTLNGGAGPSDTPQKAPAAQPGEKTNYKTQLVKEDQPGKVIWSEDFNGTALSSRWEWVRQPAAGTYGLTGTAFRFDTQAADLYVDSNNASVLTADLPNGNYVVETRVKLNLPPEGCCFNYVQAGLVIYGDDDNFIKLTHASIWETRQTEFAKEVAPVPEGYPRYGNTVVGPPSDWTYLRIVARQQGGEEQYTAYTSTDGTRWVRGGTWSHDLGNDARVGLVAMGGTGFTAEFDYVRVYRLKR